MIEVAGLNYEYADKKALTDVSFDIPDGSVTALVGPNGAGKTTLLRCLAGLDGVFSGSIRIAGIDVAAQPRSVHRLLGYLSDFFGLYEDLTVRQCLLFAASLHRINENRIEEKVQKAARLLELGPWLNHQAKNLSRGWRQRLGIAQSIIHEPKLLLLDEPAAGLDPEARVEISGLLKNLQAQGMTIIVSSHILAELEDYCTTMLVLREGKVVTHRKIADANEQGEIVRIGFAQDPGKYLPLVSALPGVSEAVVSGNSIRCRFSGDGSQRQNILKRLVEQGAPVTGFDSGPEKLQDVYLSLGNKKDNSHAS